MKKRVTCLNVISSKKNKRGSHVGMILSFVIFITFIIFLYTVINPTLNTGEDKKTILENIETQIIKNTSANFTVTSVKINTNSPEDKECIQFANLLTTEVSTMPFSMIVKNEDKEIIDHYLVSLMVPDLIINRKDKTELFFKIYSSPELNKKVVIKPKSISCTTKTNKEGEDGYTIGSIILNKYIFEINIKSLKTDYEKDYEQLKTNLNIPPGTEFEFAFTKSNGEVIIPSGERLKPANVYAEENPVQYIDEVAEIQSGFIKIIVW